MRNIQFHKARPEEFDTVLLLLKEATLWLRKKKIDRWQNWILPAPNFIDWIKRGFERNEFYFIESEDVIIGCFRLLWQDPLTWGEQENNAGDIHSFTVSRNLAGQGIGKLVLNLIESHCRQQGKETLRLDCSFNNKKLKTYYEEYGFKPVGEATVVGERVTLYEKRID